MKFARKRELWVPTLWGWTFILLALSGSAAVYVKNVHSFLAVTEPTRGRILVIEGWISSPSALKHAAQEFRTNGYSFLVVTEDPEKRWVFPVLLSCGIKEEEIVRVPVVFAARDRTYSSAVALKKWLLSSGIGETKIDVLTLDTHARRSRALFQKAFGRGYTIGIISSPDPHYDPEKWWESSEGFKSVIIETVSIVYTFLFFSPFSQG